MNLDQIIPTVPYVAAVLVVGLFLWRVFVRMFTGMEARFDDRLNQMDSRFDDRLNQMENRFDDRLNQMESRFDDRFTNVDSRFEQIDNRFQQMESRFDNRFSSLETRFESLDKKVDGLAADHHSLSRELSEFRGEMRGRLSMLVPQAAGEQ